MPAPGGSDDGSDDALVTHLRELVAFDTQNPSGRERPLADKLADELRELGAHAVEVGEVGRHAFVYARLGGETPRVLVNAHLDTVPANAGYTRSPLALEHVGQRLHGLGSADTKGAITALFAALRLRRRLGAWPEHVAVLLSGDEERGNTCMRAFLDSANARGLTHAIACEPTGCRIGIRHRGIVILRAVATSPGGHSSRADILPAPVATTARAAVALADMGKAHRGRGPQGFPGLCMNVADISGGIAMNVIPSRAELSASLRPPPGADLPALVREAEARVRDAIAVDGADIEWYVDVINPPLQTRDPAAFAGLLGAEAQACVDLDFWTEAALFVAKGIDAAVFGPGYIEQAHAPDEYVDLAQLRQARDAFLKVLR